MSKRFSPLLAGLFFAASCTLAQCQTASIPREERKGSTPLRSTKPSCVRSTSSCASDKLAGRMSLQPGDDEAVQWIVDQFTKAGLKPLAVDGARQDYSYLQSFELIQNVGLTRAAQQHHVDQKWSIYCVAFA